MATIGNRLLPETFPGADVSMSLPGKVAAVLLLGLLAAQGKCRAPSRATTWCQSPLKKWDSMPLHARNLCVAHCTAHHHTTCKLSAEQPRPRRQLPTPTWFIGRAEQLQHVTSQGCVSVQTLLIKNTESQRKIVHFYFNDNPPPSYSRYYMTQSDRARNALAE